VVKIDQKSLYDFIYRNLADFFWLDPAKQVSINPMHWLKAIYKSDRVHHFYLFPRGLCNNWVLLDQILLLSGVKFSCLIFVECLSLLFCGLMLVDLFFGIFQGIFIILLSLWDFFWELFVLALWLHVIMNMLCIFMRPRRLGKCSDLIYQDWVGDELFCALFTTIWIRCLVDYKIWLARLCSMPFIFRGLVIQN